MLARIRAAGLVWPALFAMAALGVLIGLGTWQMSRKAWKEEIIATVAARAAAPPLDHGAALALTCRPADDGLATSCEYTRVRLRGTFDPSGERYVFAGAQGSGPQAEVGYWVFTPWIAVGTSAPIFVNRGFLPERLRGDAARVAAPPATETEITAQIRTRERRSAFAGSNDAPRNVYFVRDPTELSGRGTAAGTALPGPFLSNTAMFYLELVDNSPSGSYPRPLAGSIVLPNRHLEYALTWYGLALTLIGVFAAFAAGRLATAARVA